MPKILIVFYSRTGKTKNVANDIASHLGADVEEIIDKKKRSGIFGSIIGRRDAMKEALTDIEPMNKNPADYDLVIVGTPVWSDRITPAARTYLIMNREKIAKYAFFITSGSTDPALVARSATEIAGKAPIAFTGWSTKELAAKLTYAEKLALFVNTVKGNL